MQVLAKMGSVEILRNEIRGQKGWESEFGVDGDNVMDG